MTERLSDFECAGLGLLKLRGQTTPTNELAMELLLLGLPFTDRSSGYRYSYREENLHGALNHLLNKGLLVLRDSEKTYGYSSGPSVTQYHYRPEVFADPRLLAHVETVPPATLTIAPAAEGEPGFAKQPGEVVLRFIALAETLRKLGRIDLTVKGRPAKPFLSKLIKTLGWEDTLATESHTPLSQATFFFFQLLESAGFFQLLPNTGSVGIDPDMAAFFESPYETQAEVWIRAYRSMTGWIEYKPQSVSLSDDELFRVNKFNSLRAALLMALAALPDPAGWYRIEDLSAGIYSRIGERFSLDHFSHFYPPYGATPAQVEQKHHEWQEQLRSRWAKTELPWIQGALTGPLFHLGLVELAFAPGKKKSGPALFGLTPLGRAVLYDVYRPVPGLSSAERTVPRPAQDASCWIVQPNFDVVVYLDRASAARLAFIERIAERRPSEGATALYHLTRETVYAALESGIGPGTLIDTLGRACEYPLPDNVKQTLADWASRREQLSVYHATGVLEFADGEARDAALAKKKLAGVPVGDRFLLLSGHKRIKSLAAQVSQTIDYNGPLVRCVGVSEDGAVRIERARADLLVRGEIACWAEPVLSTVEGPDSADGNRWQITRASIQRAVGAGWTADNIIDSLSQRLQDDLPPLLLVAIRAWAGARTFPTSVAVVSDLILQVGDGEVAHAVAGSALLQPYLRGRLGRQTFLVRHETVDELRGKLEEFGLRVGSDLTLDSLQYMTGKERRLHEQ
jgi:hypothetical protein